MDYKEKIEILNMAMKQAEETYLNYEKEHKDKLADTYYKEFRTIRFCLNILTDDEYAKEMETVYKSV